jgi:hypothetical protein
MKSGNIDTVVADEEDMSDANSHNNNSPER